MARRTRDVVKFILQNQYCDCLITEKSSKKLARVWQQTKNHLQKNIVSD